MIHCARHPIRPADYHCSRCQKGFCADCVEGKKLGRSEMRLCRVCGQPVARLAAYRLPLPFWRRLGGVVTFPLGGAGPWLVAAWAFFGAVALGTPAAMVSTMPDSEYFDLYNPMAVMFYYLALFAIVQRIIAASGEGEEKFPSLVTRDNPWERFKQLLWRLVGPFFAVWWPSVFTFLFFWGTYNRDPSPEMSFFTLVTLAVFILTFGAGLFLLPMAMLIINVTGNVTNAIDLRLLYRQLQLIRRDYLAGWAAWLTIMAVYALTRLAMSPVRDASTPPPVYGAYLVDCAVQMYLVLVAGHVLGSIYYINRFRLRWFAVHEHIPEFIVDGKPADMRPDDPKSVAFMVSTGLMAAPGTEPDTEAPPLAAGPPPEVSVHLRQGSYLMEHGNYEGAADAFRAALGHDPDNFEALRGLASAALRLEDWPTVTDAGRRIGAEFLRQGAIEALWDMYHGYRQTMPAFTFDPPVLNALAAWLSAGNHHLDAARLLRELAVTFPDDPATPDALLRCGQILLDPCALPDKARSVWKVLIDRHPESETAARAREALAALDEPETPPKV